MQPFCPTYIKQNTTYYISLRFELEKRKEKLYFFYELARVMSELYPWVSIIIFYSSYLIFQGVLGVRCVLCAVCLVLCLWGFDTYDDACGKSPLSTLDS
mgnify:CR=1 FL=1